MEISDFFETFYESWVLIIPFCFVFAQYSDWWRFVFVLFVLSVLFNPFI